jgi:carboxylesterase type B
MRLYRINTTKRFAEAPVGSLRWAPPVPFVSADILNATSFSPSCIQQFAFSTRDYFEELFDTPGPVNSESEDCLFLCVTFAMLPSDSAVK